MAFGKTDSESQGVSQILGLTLLVILWWVGIWGLLDTLAHLFAKGSVLKTILFYTSLIAFVLLVAFVTPKSVEHFV